MLKGQLNSVWGTKNVILTEIIWKYEKEVKLRAWSEYTFLHQIESVHRLYLQIEKID